jgi:hypothetical protein
VPISHRIPEFKNPSFRKHSRTFGPKYVFECPVCNKQFNRTKDNASLKPHKNKNGYSCSGRYGIYVETKY